MARPKGPYAEGINPSDVPLGERRDSLVVGGATRADGGKVVVVSFHPGGEHVELRDRAHMEMFVKTMRECADQQWPQN